MSLHISRFIDRVRSLDHRGQRELVLSVAEARDLQADLAKLLLALHVANQPRDDATAKIEIDGGKF